MSDAARNMEERIDAILRKNAHHVHLVQEGRMPFEELFRMEDDGREAGELYEFDAEELRELRWEERKTTFRLMLEYMFAGGPEPLGVLRAVFAIVKAVRPELLGNMSLDDIAVICCDGGKATVSARIQRIYNGKLEEAGMKVTGASFQKQSEAYSTSQLGNKNRRKGKRRKR